MTSPLITDINIGDIYISKTPGLCPRLIGLSVEEEKDESPFQFLGFLGSRAFSPENQPYWTKQGAIDNLNQNNFYLAGNINDKVNKSLDLASKQMHEKWVKGEIAAKVEEIKPEPNIPKLDIPDGYKLLTSKDIITKGAKYKFKNFNGWYVVLNSVGKTVEWGKNQFGKDIVFIAPIED